MAQQNIAVIKHTVGVRMPVQSKLGTGLNSAGQPTAPTVKTAAVVWNGARRPVGRK